MSRLLTILQQLQTNFDIQNQQLTSREQVYGPGFYGHYAANVDKDEVIDVPNVPDVYYPTYWPFALPKGKKAGSNYLPFEEQDLTNGDEFPSSTSENKEEEKEWQKVSRSYELKKIYSRLTAIDSFLSTDSNPIILKVRNYVIKVMDLFKLVISNFESFEEQIDEIIVMFYKFINGVYDIVRDIYKKAQEEE